MSLAFLFCNLLVAYKVLMFGISGAMDGEERIEKKENLIKEGEKIYNGFVGHLYMEGPNGHEHGNGKKRREHANA